MRGDRRINGRASALPLHVLLSDRVSPPRALLTRLTRAAIRASVAISESERWQVVEPQSHV